MTHPHDNPVRAELQSLDQRRADTLADALRPVALTDDTPTPETWRVVEPDGSVDVLQVQSIGGGVYIIRCDSLGREHVRAASSRCAVDRFAGQYLGAAEIRGPGEATTAEQLAAATARAEAAEQECPRLRAALRFHAPKCDRCVKLATHADVERMPPHYACDHCASRLASRAWTPLYTADVLRSLDGVPR